MSKCNLHGPVVKMLHLNAEDAGFIPGQGTKVLQATWCGQKNWGGGGASLAAQRVKNLPAIQETWVRFLGQEDPLEKEMATHSSILAWEISWTEEPGRLQSMGIQKSWTRLSN